MASLFIELPLKGYEGKLTYELFNVLAIQRAGPAVDCNNDPATILVLGDREDNYVIVSLPYDEVKQLLAGVKV